VPHVTDPIELVIFDCDGVLVDSERLAVRIEAEVISSLGWPLNEAEIIDRFVGRSDADMQAEIERHIGRAVDWEVEFAPRYRDVFQRELTPVDGVIDALDALAVATCVASSGTHEKLQFTLGLTGLYDRFAGRIFSASEVANGKPAPDLFLLAASRMGVEPARCAIVEDSVAGVVAGTAAGMQVFAFAGGVTDASKLRRDAVVVFDDMRSLPALLTASIQPGP
jgi:HAD superfamily hydrolase (TIGR01509 family)